MFAFAKINKPNYLRYRSRKYLSKNNVIGYKMYLSGRFRRRQRAGHY
jgi:hypothetical protein